jgi:hypothetical protein
MPGGVKADELEDIKKELAELSKAYEMSVAATKPLEGEVEALHRQLLGIEGKINQANEDLEKLAADIVEREVDLGVFEKLLAERVRAAYVRSYYGDRWWAWLAEGGAAQAVREMGYWQAAAKQDRGLIASVSARIVQLNEDKQQVEEDKKRLASLQVEVDRQKGFYEGEIAKAKEYQQVLSGKIAQLTARQQELLAEKTGTFTTSVGEVPLADDPASRPDYNPGFSPAFAAFSFGAPHYKGMSQYGAKGRGEAGQNEEEILRAYYGDVRVEQRGDLPGSISTGAGSLPFEDNYLLGIAEMPSDWPLAALKAQAIAARSYALAYIGWRMGNPGGGSGTICTSENCQVYNSGKAGSPPSAWRQAVTETRGKILVSNSSGEVVNAWYAASSGGYQESYSSLGHTTPAFWDTGCGDQGCWTGGAWEKRGGSPWFYKAWYKSRSGKSCGRSHPWLTEDEMAEIVNVALVLKSDPGSAGHLSQTDGCLGSVPDTWDNGRLRQEAEKWGGPVSRINDVSVTYATNGVTASVHIDTDKGGKDFSGEDFKLAFNLRAPGVVHLKSGLFNIEKKWGWKLESRCLGDRNWQWKFEGRN